MAMAAAAPTLTERVEPNDSIKRTSWVLSSNSLVMPLFSEPKMRVVFLLNFLLWRGWARSVLFSMAISSLVS